MPIVVIKKGIVPDMRGKLYSANFISVENKKPYYAGYPVHNIQAATELQASKYLYMVVSYGRVIGSIALTQENAECIINLLKRRYDNHTA